MSLHPVRHSSGIAITLGPADHREFSFLVDGDGQVTELAGWGHAGPLPDTGHFVNAPPNPMAVHTVLVDVARDGDALTPAIFGALRQLVVAHLERYAEVQVWVASGSPHELRWWADRGCPDPADETEAEPEVATDADVSDEDGGDGSGVPADDIRVSLRARLDAMGVPWDGRWGEKKLAEVLEDAEEAATNLG